MPRDTRTYITVHDGMPDHPKVEALDDAAFRVLITLWCWCSRNRTDGMVKQASWDRKVPLAIASQLLEAGLAHAVEGGFMIHDYTEHQRTAEEIEALKSTRAEAGRLGGLAKASNRVASAKANGKQASSKSVADTDTDTDTDTDKTKTSSNAAAFDAEFERFWALYPRKVGKGQARTAYRKARTKATVEQIATALHAYIRAVRSLAPDKVRHPATWLNGEPWDDDPAAIAPDSRPLSAVPLPKYESPSAPDRDSLPWKDVS